MLDTVESFWSRWRFGWLLPPAFVVAGLAETSLRELEPRASLLILALVMPMPLFWRIRFPLETLVACVAFLLVGQVIAEKDDYPVSLGCVALVATYSAAAHLRGRRFEVADLLVVVAIIASAGIGASKNSSAVATNLLVSLVSLTVLFRGAWYAGRRTLQRRDRERAEIADRELKARTALREERARIARELHDVVAHAMSVIVLQARGARHSCRTARTRLARRSTRSSTTASQGLAEMRRLLGSLRDREERRSRRNPRSRSSTRCCPRSPRRRASQSTSASRDRPASSRSRSRPVRLPHRPGGPDKHPQARRTGACSVLLRYARDALEVEISRHRRRRTATAVAGTRLAGMRERVALSAGELEAGPLGRGRLPGLGPAAAVISVLLADDQRLVRSGFRMILRADPDIEVVGEAGDGEEAVGSLASAARCCADGHPHADAWTASPRPAAPAPGGDRSPRARPDDVRPRRIRLRRAPRRRQRLPAEGRPRRTTRRRDPRGR